VGKTHAPPAPRAGNQKHPHERGEDWELDQDLKEVAETPPRAWGRRVVARKVGTERRNTPTSVGKTTEVSECPGHTGNTPTSVGKTISAAAFGFSQ